MIVRGCALLLYEGSYKQNRQAEAEKHFKQLEQLFKERLCVKPYEKICNLNKEITLNHDNIIHRYSRGAVVCDYEEFMKN